MDVQDRSQNSASKKNFYLLYEIELAFTNDLASMRA